MGGGTGYIPVADLNRPTLLAAQGGGSMGILNNGPGILYVANRRYFAWNDGYGVIPIPVGGTFAADGSQDLYGMPAPAGAVSLGIVQSFSEYGAASGSFTAKPTATNCLVIAVMTVGLTSGDVPAISGVTVGGVADNFQKAITETSGFVNSEYSLASLWVDFSCAGGQQAIVASLANEDAAATFIVGYEVQGLYAGTVDKTAGAVSSASGTAWSSGATATSTYAKEFWVGAGSTTSFATGPASPWANISPASPDDGIAGSQITSATGAATYAGSQADSGCWAAVVATLAPEQFAAGSSVPAYVSLLSSSITAPP